MAGRASGKDSRLSLILAWTRSHDQLGAADLEPELLNVIVIPRLTDSEDLKHPKMYQ